MGVSSIGTRTSESFGVEKSNRDAIVDEDQQLDADEYNRVADALIEVQEAIGTTVDPDIGSLEARAVAASDAITALDVRIDSLESDFAGLGTLATQDGTFSGTHSGTSSGTNTGDQTITLTGHVTGSGTGSFACTIPSGTIANSMRANGVAGQIPTWDASGVAAVVAVGTAGQVLTSNGAGLPPTMQDAPSTINAEIIALKAVSTWRARTPANDAVAWYGLGYSPSLKRFVACASSGALMSSDDGGRTWTTRTASVADNWRAVAWSPTLSLFVVSGVGSNVMTSPDGITWTTRALGVSITSVSAIWLPAPHSRFVVANQSGGTAYAFTSADGVNWSAQAGATIPIGKMAFAPLLGGASGRIFAVGSGTAGAHSDDGGVTWSSSTLPSSNSWIAAAWSDTLGKFVAVSFNDSAATGKRIAVSSDGLTFADHAANPAGNAWYEITWISELEVFVAVAGSGTSGLYAAASFNGTFWFPLDTSANNDWRACAYSPEYHTLVASAVGGTNRVMTT